ncbi:neuropeptide Y receptor type 1-like [Actinia tenebrosa]|uniref:Neuropeptide Y receptor type 1-like n=1 Tax=Actinia tenebrosa TaxID=6105 RepID=A0A6P8J1U7_ACTTE|nr:neuropeptide Y receptor type 1-like [Actinia tenebrosa]
MNGSDNLTQSSLSCFSVPDSHLVLTVKIMAILLVGGFAVFGNILIIFLAARFTVKRNIHHLIINMAVSDILVAIMYSYHNIRSLLRLPYFWELWDNDVFGNILCKAYYFFYSASKYVTLTSLLIISVERFRSTKVTVRRVRPYTLKKRLALVSCSWLLPMGLKAYVPWYFKIHQDSNTRGCYPNFLRAFFVLFSFDQLFVLLTMCLVVIFNIMTSFRLCKSRRTFPQGNFTEEQNRTREKRTAKAVKMVLCSLLLYTCCYLPGFVYYFLFAFDLTTEFPSYSFETLNFMLSFLLLVNSCFSPCIYIVFLIEFRQAAKRLLH